MAFLSFEIRAVNDDSCFSELGDSEVSDEFAREMELKRMEVQRVGAYGNRTVFVGEGAGQMGGGVMQGMAMYKGIQEASAALK